jgi:hypothetical protein
MTLRASVREEQLLLATCAAADYMNRPWLEPCGEQLSAVGFH